jgi:hypothetical protein
MISGKVFDLSLLEIIARRDDFHFPGLDDVGVRS